MSRVRRRNPKAKQLGPKETDHSKPTSAPKVVLLIGLMIVVAAMVFVVYWPALSATVRSFDDDQYMTYNPLVRNPSWPSAKRFLVEILEPSTVGGYYQPLSMTSLMLDYASGGRPDNLQPFHRTSLILHVCNTCLVIVLLYLLFGQPWVAAMVGLLFGVHPMIVETVSWVGERKTVLAAFFALWCLVLYVGYARTNNWKYYAGCLAMYVLALMSKPTSTPLPVCMLLMDFWPLRRLSGRTILEKLPFFAMGGISAIVTVVSQGRTAAVTMPSEYSPLRIPLILCHNIIFYLYKIVWPTNLSSHYAFPDPISLKDGMIRAGVIGTAILIPLLLISLRWTRSLLVGWLFFFVAIFPTMGVIGFTTVIASDKFAYLPSVGLMLPLAWLTTRLWGTGSWVDRGRGLRVGTLVVVVLLAAAETRATRRYLHLWQDSLTFHEYMLTLTPNSAPVHNCVGLALAERGRLDEAIEHYEKALRINPQWLSAHSNLGSVLSKLGRTEEAIEHYIAAIRINPHYEHAYFNLANAYYQTKRADKAIKTYKRLLEFNSEYCQAHNNLGFILLKQGKTDEAIQHFKEALRLYPEYLDGYTNMGRAMFAKGEYDKAIEYFNKVLKRKPDSAATHVSLADTLMRLAKFDEAIVHYGDATRIDPKHALAYANLGLVLGNVNRLDEAAQAYRSALRIQPMIADWHCALGDLLGQQNKINEAITAYREALRVDPNHEKARQRLTAASAVSSKQPK